MSGPFTLILLKSASDVMLAQNCWISSSVPGSECRVIARKTEHDESLVLVRT